MTNSALEVRRDELAKRLEGFRMAPSPEVSALVRQADAAVAAMKAEVETAEAELAEIDQQLSVRERDRRDAAVQEREAQWHEKRRRVLDIEEERLQAVGDAEAATRALADALERIIETSARFASVAKDLSTAGKVPGALNPMELVSRMAMRVASVMSTVKGHRNRFGPLEWPSGASGLYPADRSWADDEERRMATQLIQPLLEKGKA